MQKWASEAVLLSIPALAARAAPAQQREKVSTTYGASMDPRQQLKAS
jgi:hypothetical protein